MLEKKSFMLKLITFSFNIDYVLKINVKQIIHNTFFFLLFFLILVYSDLTSLEGKKKSKLELVYVCRLI